MTTVKKLLTFMNLDEFTRVVVLGAEDRYYLGGGYPPDVMRRFGSKRVCSTDILEEKLMIFVKQ